MADVSPEPLWKAAAAVEIVDVAGRILGNPRRHAPSATAAETLALAFAVEKLIDIALDAETLIAAIDELETGDSEAMMEKDHRIAVQCAAITVKLAAIRRAADKQTSKQTQTGDEHAGLHS